MRRLRTSIVTVSLIVVGLMGQRGELSAQPARADAVISPQSITTAPPETSGPVLATKTTSPNVAFLLSATMPGTGQLYAKAKRGYVYLAAEAVMLVTYALTHRDAENLLDDYVQEVKARVSFDGAGSFDAWNLEDFEHATDFENWHNVYTDDGGEPIERVGKFFWTENFKDYDPEQGDDIPPTKARLTAQQLRFDSNDRFKRARFFLGAVIFNHLVSAIDARFAARSGAAPSDRPITMRLQSDDPADSAGNGVLALAVEWCGRF